MKISIKEAGTHSKFLKETIESLQNVIKYSLNKQLFSETELHKRSAVVKDTQDETLEVELEADYEISVDNLTKLILHLTEEKLTLANAIAEAKKDMFVDIDGVQVNLDAAIEFNGLRRKMSKQYLKRLNLLKDQKRETSAVAYTMNAEQNPVPYNYKVEVTRKLSFDKGSITKTDKEILMKAEKISTRIDELMSSESVEFTSDFSHFDTVEDVIQKFLAE